MFTAKRLRASILRWTNHNKSGLKRTIKIVGHTFVDNATKPGIRITIERLSVTTIRTHSKKTYCELCRRSLGEIHLSPLSIEQGGTEPVTSARKTDDEKEK